jgi:biopolymer transport protein ExbD
MSFNTNSGGGPMADINVTPLVDVMLVLLIIFMITAPLMAHKVQVKLPLASLDNKPEIIVPPVTIAVKATGEVYWNDQLMTEELLVQNLSITVAREPQPQVDIRADNNTKYSYIQKTVKTVRMSGMRKVGFVSSPERD